MTQQAAAGFPVAAFAAFLLTGCAVTPPAPTPASAPAPAPETPRFPGTRPLDDSYTVSQRYYANRGDHPEFAMPEVAMGDGRRILFDRRYQLIGTRELHADVFLPASDTATGQAIVLIHGGAWRSGNKSNFYAMAAQLAARGYAVILPEYRLAPEAGYPAGLIDINAAIGWTQDMADAFGIDPDRIAIGGESSGGQMAGLIAFTGGTALFGVDGHKAPQVNALIDLDGVLDFTTPLALANENAAGAESSAAKWLGGPYEAMPDRWAEASAVHHLGPASPPTLVISGEADRFTAGREEVERVLTAKGTPYRHVHFAGLPHTFWLFDPYLGQVVDAIDSFLRGDVAPSPTNDRIDRP